MTPVAPAAALPSPDASTAAPVAGRDGAAVWASPALAVALSVAAYAIIVAPRLVLGLCGGDAGELQTAVATLGITHPPGYSTYVLIGWLLTRVPILEPAAMLTIINAICGLVAIALLAWFAARAGARVVAVTLALLWLICHHVVLDSFVMPEVYAPSLMLLLITIACVWRAGHRRRWTPLVWAAIAFGLLVANRPTAVVLAPGLLLLLLLTPAAASLRPQVIRRTAALALIAAIPAIVTVAYVLLRDRPDIPYNYMTINADCPMTFEPGWYENASRWDRAVWLLTAKQYHRSVAPSLADAAGQIRSLGDQLGRPDWVSLIGVLTLASVGLLAVIRRSVRAGAVVVTMLAGNLVFYVLYRQAGLPAMMLPLLAMIAGLMAVGVSTVAVGLRAGVGGEFAAVGVFAAMAWWTADADFLPPREDQPTARYAASLDLGALPPHADVLIDIDRPCHELAYELVVHHNRRDVQLRIVRVSEWAEKVSADPRRRWIYASEGPVPDGYALAPIGGLWIAHPQSSDARTAAPRACNVPDLER